jgi:hypothetical protein
MRRNVRRLNREVNEAPSSFAARSEKRGGGGAAAGADGGAAGDGDSGEDGAYTAGGESEASRKKRGMRKAANLAELNRYYTAATEAAQVRWRCYCCVLCAVWS